MNEELSYDDFVYCRFEVNRIGERLNIKALDHFQEARDSYLPILPTAKWFTAPSTLAWGRSSDSPLSAFWFRYSPECWSINFSGMYPSSATDWPFSLSLSLSLLLSVSLCFFLSFLLSLFCWLAFGSVQHGQFQRYQILPWTFVWCDPGGGSISFSHKNPAEFSRHPPRAL